MFRYVVTVLVLFAIAFPVQAGHRLTLSAPLVAAGAEAGKINGIVVAVMGVILLGSLVWMAGLLETDREHFRRGDLPGRMVVPVIASMALLLGTCAYSLFSMPGPIFLLWLFKAVVIAALVLLKAYFGPILCGIAVSYQVYSLGTDGRLASLPGITDLLEWLFNFAPREFAVCFLILQVIYCAVSSGIDLEDL